MAEQLIEILNRRPGGGAEAPVDAPHQLVDLPLELAVLGRLGAAGHRDLEQHHLLLVLGMRLEQVLDRDDPLGYPLGVVQAVRAEDDSLAARQARGGTLARHRGKALEVDSDRKGSDAADASLELDAPRLARHLDAQEALHAVEEVPRVGFHVEADEVAGQHPAQEIPSPGKHSEDVVGGKGDVEEEGEAHLGKRAAQVERRPKQVVVVDPDEVRLLRLLQRGLGEAQVHLLVDGPVQPIETRAARERVEERPERAVGEPVVVALQLGLREPDRPDPIG